MRVPDPSVSRKDARERVRPITTIFLGHGRGGLVSGLIVFTFAPEAEGHGTDAAFESFQQKRGIIRVRIPIIKMITLAITIETGGSGGRKGPIAQIGAGFGSFLATQLKLSARDRRIMLAAGMGAGVGSIFRAPLAGALFSAEILYRDADIEADVIVPSAIASIIGFSVFSSFLPADLQYAPLFGNRLQYAMSSPMELIPLTLLSCVLVLVGIEYIKIFYGTRDVFHQLPVLPHFRPMIGAALAGICGLMLYYFMRQDMRALPVLSSGYGTLQSAFDGTESGMTLSLLISIALVKIMTTSLTISSGGSGGVFGPSMVIGGCTGAAIGELFHRLWPTLVPHPQIYGIVGMAGFFAGCAHTPISTIIMVSEMTGDYKLLVPNMWVCTLCFLLCRRWALYEKQVPSRLESPAHRGDFIVDLLEGIFARDVPLTVRQTIPESMMLREIVKLIPNTEQNYFPVVDDEQRLVGIFTTDDVRSFLYDDSIWTLATARHVMTTNFVSVVPKDDLNTAMRRFTDLNLDELPVLTSRATVKLSGILRRRDVIAVYYQQLVKREHEAMSTT